MCIIGNFKEIKSSRQYKIFKIELISIQVYNSIKYLNKKKKTREITVIYIKP